MKKGLTFMILIGMIASFSATVLADYSEQARLIRADKEEYDTIVERLDGSQWLLQHNRVCQSMTTEFPLTLIIKNDVISQLKVGFNELCKVYVSMPYSGEGTLDKLIKSQNLIIPDHEAEITWGDEKHLIDYNGKGCVQLYEFVGKRVYFSFGKEGAGEHYMILPGNQGVCPFTLKESTLLENKDSDSEKLKINGLDYQAQNNQIYFYWEPETSLERPFYGLAYSKYPIDYKKYIDWKEMPNAQLTTQHSHTFTRLANGQEYYFYLTTLNADLKPGLWTEVKLAPVAPKKEDYVIEGEEERFEVKVKDAGEYFLITWPKDPFAKRYFIRFFVNGKQELFKILKADQQEWIIPKEPEYKGKGLRFTIKTLADRFNPTQKDGVYWEVTE